MRRPRAAFLVTVLVAVLAKGCKCSPDDIPADPNCPDGRASAATVILEGQLAGIRPLGSAKDIQVRGNRVSTDPCFAEGARSAFSVRLQGNTTVTDTQANLAPGDWTFQVTALSGGEHAPLTLPRNLAPGATVTLRLSGTADGSMQANFQ